MTEVNTKTVRDFDEVVAMAKIKLLMAKLQPRDVKTVAIWFKAKFCDE